ncbi:MAG: EAL domain-containing protein [Bulleidia sp.]
MWHFDYTFPTLILQSYLAILFVSRRRLPVWLTNVYSWMLAANLITLALDYFSSSMDNSWENYPGGVLTSVNMLFFVLFILRIFLFVKFTMVLMRQWDQNSRGLVLACLIPELLMLALIVTSPLTGLIFRITDQGYVSGPLYRLINASIFYCCILVEVSLMRGKKTAPDVRRIGAHMYSTVLITGGIIRTLLPSILVMNMFSMFANAVIMFEYLNPDSFTDVGTGLFNLRGWRSVLDDIYRGRRKKQVCIVGFVVRDFNGLRDMYGDQQMEEGTRIISQYLNQTFPKMNAFYVEDGRFLLMANQAVEEDEILETLKQRFRQHWRGEHADLVLQAGMLRVSRNCSFSDKETATGFLRYAFRMAANPSERKDVVADSRLLAEYQRMIYVRKCLNHAIDCQGIEMYLQPIVYAENGTLAGAEALARIRDEDGRLIGPDEFIPVAESNSMIEALGEQMFRKACAFMAEEEVKNSPLKWINVNVSPLQCMDASLADTYYRIYRTYALKPNSIYLEITEQSLKDSSVLHKQMIRLKEDGIPFVLDDFGSMSSNLERLKDNPFMSVKLDKNMVWSYMKEPDFIMPHIISACHEMHITVTAEGIENAEMAAEFSDLGCDYFQGFYYSKPLPEAEFRKKYCQEDRS